MFRHKKVYKTNKLGVCFVNCWTKQEDIEERII